jgi:hypothetical protein
VGAAFLSKHLFSNMVLNPQTFTLRFWFIAPSTVIGKVKAKFSKKQATKAQRGSRCIALLFLQLGARWG